MYQKLLVAILGLVVGASPAAASMADCHNLYVIRVVLAGSSSADPSVVFILAENPSASSGSGVLSLPSSWTTSGTDKALAALIAARASGRTISVKTTASDQCSIANADRTVVQIDFGNTPAIW